MLLICIGDDGDVHSFKNVLSYDCLTNEDLQTVCKDMKIETVFTAEEMEVIKHRLGRFDHFPDYDDLRYVVQLVLEDRT